MNEDQIEARVSAYVNALPGTLLESSASEIDLNTAKEIYRDGLKDGLERWKGPIQDLINQGYEIQILNPDGATFNERYHVFKHLSKLGTRTVLTDEYGKIIGQQG